VYLLFCYGGLRRKNLDQISILQNCLGTALELLENYRKKTLKSVVDDLKHCNIPMLGHRENITNNCNS
jgi:hypothetical protein